MTELTCTICNSLLPADGPPICPDCDGLSASPPTLRKAEAHHLLAGKVLLVLSFLAAGFSALAAAAVCAYAVYRFKRGSRASELVASRWAYVATLMTVAWLFVFAWLRYREYFPAPDLPPN